MDFDQKEELKRRSKLKSKETSLPFQMLSAEKKPNELVVYYVCFQCASEIPIKMSTKEPYKCVHCGSRILLKRRNPSYPSLYKAR